MLALLLVGCGAGDDGSLAVRQPTASLAPTFTPLPTATPLPTLTPFPTRTPPPTPTATVPPATPTPTSTPVPSATPAPSATATVAAVVAPAPGQVLLQNITHDWQRLNNCGPTTAAMALSYYGYTFTQYDIAPLVKGADTDKNVAPEDLTAFLRAQGFAAPIRVNGDLAMLEQLLANGVPVIVEQWLEREGDPLTGHYRLVRGYDENAGVFIVNDSYLGPNLRYDMQTFDRWWRAFNRLYIPLYRPEQEATVRAIVGEAAWPEEGMWQGAAARAQQALAQNPNDLYAWFNLGTARLRLGDAAGAVEAFEQAVALGLPQRMLWYQFAPFEAWNATAQYERTLAMSEPYLQWQIEEIHYHRGYALEGLGRYDEARAEYNLALALHPNFAPALQGIARLGG